MKGYYNINLLMYSIQTTACQIVIISLFSSAAGSTEE